MVMFVSRGGMDTSVNAMSGYLQMRNRMARSHLSSVDARRDSLASLCLLFESDWLAGKLGISPATL
jgi:hypothetical protein